MKIFIHNSRIIVSIKQGCNHKLVFNNIEQMTKKLNEDIMKNNLKYDEIVIVWNNDNNNKCLKIDFNEAQNEILSNKDCVWDINHKNNLKVDELKDKWMEILPITKGEEITIGFLSHYKEEAGKDAGIIKDKGEEYINKLDNKDPFKGSRLFLDSDNLEI